MFQSSITGALLFIGQLCVGPTQISDDPVQTRTKMILGVMALAAVFAGPGLLIVGLTGWSPFGIFDWLHDWIRSRSEDRHQRTSVSVPAAHGHLQLFVSPGSWSNQSSQATAATRCATGQFA